MLINVNVNANKMKELFEKIMFYCKNITHAGFSISFFTLVIFLSFYNSLLRF